MATILFIVVVIMAGAVFFDHNDWESSGRPAAINCG